MGVIGGVAGQKSPGSGVNDTAVPQLSGTAKSCNSYPMSIEYEDEDDNNSEVAAGIVL